MAERDLELEKKACAGDGSAFAVLWTGWLPDLHRLYRGMLEGPEEVEDCTGELYIKLSQAIVGETLQKGFEPWAFVIARNFAIDWLRGAESEESNIPIDQPIPSDGDQPEKVPLDRATYEDQQLAEDLAAGGERAKAVNDLLRDLPVLQRRAFVLLVVEEFSHEEIGRYLGVKAEEVPGLLDKARKALRVRRARVPAE